MQSASVQLTFCDYIKCTLAHSTRRRIFAGTFDDISTGAKEKSGRFLVAGDRQRQHAAGTGADHVVPGRENPGIKCDYG